MEDSKANWSELCPEILLEIADRLGTRPNVYNFRQVCKNWRFSLSYIPRLLPHLSPLFPHRFFAFDNDFFASISRGTLHHVVSDAVLLLRPRNLPEQEQQPPPPWLVTVEEFYRGRMSVRLPLSKIRASGQLGNDVDLPIRLNMSDINVTCIASGYSLRAPVTDQDLSSNGRSLYKNKLTLLAKSDGREPVSAKDYTAMVWFADGSVAWVKLGRSLDWGFLAHQGTSKFDDIVSFLRRVYAVDRRGRVYVVNHDLDWGTAGNFQQTLRMECIVSDSICSGCDSDRRKRLVVDSFGVLYLVELVDHCNDKVHFKVYKLDEQHCKMEEAVDLGDDRILFVGIDWCFFAPAAEFPGCRGNCVIFVRDSFPSYDGRTQIDEFPFKGANKNLEFAVFHFEDGEARPISDFPGYSELLWPPPAWFYSASSSS